MDQIITEDISKNKDRSDEIARRFTGSSLESLSKLLAASAVALYGSGYLVTSLNSFRYGFAEMNPLRPRVLAAGVWFAFLLFIPLTILLEVRLQLAEKMKTVEAWEKPLRWYYGVLLASNGALIFAAKVFHFDASPTTEFSWGALVRTILVAGTGIHVFFFPSTRYRPLSATILSGLSVWSMYQIGNDLLLNGVFTSSSLTLWIVGIAAVVAFETVYATAEGQLRRIAFEVLIALFIFARYFYPHIQSAWGGGGLIPVTIVMSKDSVVMPSARIGCSLVDETDAGYYLIGEKEVRATFVPRSAVSLVYFDSQNGSKSLLLASGK